MNTDQWIEKLTQQLTAQQVDLAFKQLLKQGEDPGGGIGGFRFLKHLMADPSLTEDDVVQIYMNVKTTLKRVLSDIPTIYYFEAD
jgi:hypothetical protein